MKNDSIKIFIISCLAWGIASFQGCEKVYKDLKEESEWSRTYIPVQHNGLQVGLVAMSQRVITDLDHNLDTASTITFSLQDDQRNPIWDDPQAEMMIQIYEPSPGLGSAITHEIYIPASTRGIQNTLGNLRAGFSKAFLPSQVKIQFLHCTNGNPFGGRYIGYADGKGMTYDGDSLIHVEHLFICPFNATVNADGYMEIRFVNYPAILGLQGRVIDGTFNGQLVLPNDSFQIKTTHFPPGSLSTMLAKFDSAGIAELDSLTHIYLDFQPR